MHTVCVVVEFINASMCFGAIATPSGSSHKVISNSYVIEIH
jgi:hypothetical protein